MKTISIFIFSLEYYYTFDYIIKIKRKSVGYLRVEMVGLSYGGLSILELWRHYSKSQAFLRIYFILSKNNKNMNAFVFSLIIYMSGLPVRVLRIFYKIIFKTKGSMRNRLENLCFECDMLTKGKKIELLDGILYFNPLNIKKLLTFDSKINSWDASKKINFLMDLKEVYVKYEKHSNERINFWMITLKTKEGNKVNIKHPGLFYKDNAIHATSKIPNRIDNSQKILPNIPCLTLQSAVKPGTILSEGALDLKMYGLPISIPKNQFYATIFDIPEYSDKFNLSKYDCDVNYNRMNDFYGVMVKYGLNKDEIILRSLLRDDYLKDLIDLPEDFILEWEMGEV